MRKSVASSWLTTLLLHVESKPCVLLRLDEGDSARLRESRAGFNEFTLARPHELLSGIKTPTVCLVYETPSSWMRPEGAGMHAYIGIVSSRSAITTLDTRIKIKRAIRIEPGMEQALLKLLGTSSHADQLRKKLALKVPVIVLSPKLSSALISALAGIAGNEGPMRAVIESLHVPRRYVNFSAIQEDAVQTALKAFGLGASDRAEQVELIEGKATALARVPLLDDAVVENSPASANEVVLRMVQPRMPLIEDSAIEKDARSVPGYTLMSSDLTGRAVFKKGQERLEVFTANRRDLEHVFGVDLIYLNLTKKNIVMVQYKMLEPNRREGQSSDWLYRPEANMKKEVARMKKFAKQHAPGPLEYRLNPQVFYLKFVKRDGALSSGGIVTPIDHYEQVLADPACKGPRDAIRISYESLKGRYLRQGAFLDLIQSGYIGAHAATTDYLHTLVDAVLKGNRAVVMAVQFPNDITNATVSP